jgi:hypothetical protein
MMTGMGSFSSLPQLVCLIRAPGIEGRIFGGDLGYEMRTPF